MSEPIQSISQGNYILQGTVATSAGIVGDGTTQNPLRADETVLWSGNSNHITANQTWTATLNEPVSNFEKIGILLTHSYGWNIADAPGNPGEMRETCVISGIAYWSFLDDLKPSFMNAGGNAPQYDANIAYSSGTNFTCVGYGRHTLTTAGVLTTPVTTNRGVTLLRVIGINRKAQ